VDVRLVARIPDDPITWRVECSVQGQGELYRTEIGAEVPSIGCDCGDEERSDFGGQLLECGSVEAADAGWTQPDEGRTDVRVRWNGGPVRRAAPDIRRRSPRCHVG
jgi:hypothetical protein